MLLNLRKGEMERREVGYEVQVLTIGPKGGERWQTIDVGTSTRTGTQLPLSEARQIAGLFTEQMARQPEGRKHVRHGHTGWNVDGLRIVKTVLESVIIDEAGHEASGDVEITAEDLAPVLHEAFRDAVHPGPRDPDTDFPALTDIDPALRGGWIVVATGAISVAEYVSDMYRAAIRDALSALKPDDAVAVILESAIDRIRITATPNGPVLAWKPPSPDGESFTREEIATAVRALSNRPEAYLAALLGALDGYRASTRAEARCATSGPGQEIPAIPSTQNGESE